MKYIMYESRRGPPWLLELRPVSPKKGISSSKVTIMNGDENNMGSQEHMECKVQDRGEFDMGEA